MPELPEVETIVRQLRRQVMGKSIAAVRLHWPRSLAGSKREFQRRLRGMTVAGVWRRGKYIGIEGADGTYFTIHLRMTGKLVSEISPPDRKHARVRFTFADGSLLHFVDARKFGRMRLWPCRGESCPGLGPEPLREATVLSVLRGLRTRRPIKSVLLDQSIFGRHRQHLRRRGAVRCRHPSLDRCRRFERQEAETSGRFRAADPEAGYRPPRHHPAQLPLRG
jgi:formamidopyrimidine-DNA glycosylase